MVVQNQPNRSTAEVAKQAGVHKDTLLRWLRDGLVPEPRRDRRGWRVFSAQETEMIVQFAKADLREESGQRLESPRVPELDPLDKIAWDFVNASTSYLTHGIHPYPAKFIPQIPNALIQALSSVGETVADIFCGSGTTLVEALILKRNALGIDANPLACLISQAKTTRLHPEDIQALEEISAWALARAESVNRRDQVSLFAAEAPSERPTSPDSDAIKFWFDDFITLELAEIRRWCADCPSEASRVLAQTAFSSIIVSVSRQDSDTRYVRRQKHLQPGDAFRRFARSLTETLEAAKQFTAVVEERFSSRVIAANLLETPDIGPIDLIVCSPPYPNAYSYHLYHMTRMLWLGMDPHKFKKIEIGSHRKYSRRGPNRVGVDTFQSELRTILIWAARHLRRNRYACFVVGDSILDGKKINNAEVLSDVARECGFGEVKRIHRRLQENRKAFNPAYGKIKTEHIVILQNPKKGD